MTSNRTKVVGDQVITTAEVRAKRIDMTEGTSTMVCRGPALLRGVNVNTTQAAFATDFLDGEGGSAVDSIPASQAAGSWIPYGDAYYPNGIWTSHNAGATGTITVKYIPLG